jgi:hypothetical protein
MGIYYSDLFLGWGAGEGGGDAEGNEDAAGDVAWGGAEEQGEGVSGKHRLRRHVRRGVSSCSAA